MFIRSKLNFPNEQIKSIGDFLWGLMSSLWNAKTIIYTFLIDGFRENKIEIPSRVLKRMSYVISRRSIDLTGYGILESYSYQRVVNKRFSDKGKFFILACIDLGKEILRFYNISLETSLNMVSNCVDLKFIDQNHLKDFIYLLSGLYLLLEIFKKISISNLRFLVIVSVYKLTKRFNRPVSKREIFEYLRKLSDVKYLDYSYVSKILDYFSVFDKESSDPESWLRELISWFIIKFKEISIRAEDIIEKARPRIHLFLKIRSYDNLRENSYELTSLGVYFIEEFLLKSMRELMRTSQSIMPSTQSWYAKTPLRDSKEAKSTEIPINIVSTLSPKSTFLMVQFDEMLANIISLLKEGKFSEIVRFHKNLVQLGDEAIKRFWLVISNLILNQMQSFVVTQNISKIYDWASNIIDSIITFGGNILIFSGGYIGTNAAELELLNAHKKYAEKHDALLRAIDKDFRQIRYERIYVPGAIVYDIYLSLLEVGYPENLVDIEITSAINWLDKLIKNRHKMNLKILFSPVLQMNQFSTLLAEINTGDMKEYYTLLLLYSGGSRRKGSAIYFKEIGEARVYNSVYRSLRSLDELNLTRPYWDMDIRSIILNIIKDSTQYYIDLLDKRNPEESQRLEMLLEKFEKQYREHFGIEANIPKTFHY